MLAFNAELVSLNIIAAVFIAISVFRVNAALVIAVCIAISFVLAFILIKSGKG
jgi:Cu/Ag efflux pump CusA